MTNRGPQIAVLDGDAETAVVNPERVRGFVRAAGGHLVDLDTDHRAAADLDGIIAIGTAGIRAAAMVSGVGAGANAEAGEVGSTAEDDSTEGDTAAADLTEDDSADDSLDSTSLPPVLPIGVGRLGVPPGSTQSAIESAIDAAIKAVVDGTTVPVSHPVLSVSVGTELIGSGLFDAALVTDEPARISEYGVSLPSGHEHVMRADAVVVATPLGSDGYARAAGGPTLDPGTGLSVVPVAPFTTDATTWVARDAVTLTVERDEEPVSLVIDDSRAVGVPPGKPVRIETRRQLDLLSVPAIRDDR